MIRGPYNHLLSIVRDLSYTSLCPVWIDSTETFSAMDCPGSENSRQGSEFLKPGLLSEDLSTRNVSTMPPPKRLIHSTSNGNVQHPPRTIPPPPPPKFPSSTVTLPLQKADAKDILKKPTLDPASDTLVKLVEYGEEDDGDGDAEEASASIPGVSKAAKPFWAV